MKRSPALLSFILVLFFSLVFPFLLSAQGGGMGGNSKRIKGKTKFMPVPYFNYDRSMGVTVGAVPILMFNPTAKDTISPSSLIGSVGLWSTNNTWFLMGFGVFYLNEDNWRLTTAGGVGVMHFQFYLDGLVGSWRWFNGATVTCSQDGTCTASNGFHAKWSCTDPAGRFEIQWSRKGKNVEFVDSMSLSGDGQNITGKNQFGGSVSANRKP